MRRPAVGELGCFSTCPVSLGPGVWHGVVGCASLAVRPIDDVDGAVTAAVGSLALDPGPGHALVHALAHAHALKAGAVTLASGLGRGLEPGRGPDDGQRREGGRLAGGEAVGTLREGERGQLTGPAPPAEDGAPARRPQDREGRRTKGQGTIMAPVVGRLVTRVTPRRATLRPVEAAVNVGRPVVSAR